jgi:hypothetical protein
MKMKCILYGFFSTLVVSSMLLCVFLAGGQEGFVIQLLDNTLSVAEPPSLLLIGIGLVGLSFVYRRKRI